MTLRSARPTNPRTAGNGVPADAGDVILEIHDRPDRTHRLVGHVTSGGPAVVRVDVGRGPGWTGVGSVDDDGRFVMDGLIAGPARVRVEPQAGGTVVTVWFTI